MNISEKDLKKLWGLAAGKCSNPTCGIDCITFLDQNNSTVIGEMAHIIANSPIGPRGNGIGGKDTYENLILLCPTHHTTIDKAPEGTFHVELLLEWKRRHEERVRNSLKVVRFDDKRQMANAIKILLIENHAIWKKFGPESELAKNDPLSNLSDYWDLVKLATIVPNNSKIAEIIRNHKDLIDIDDYAVFVELVLHIEFFEQSCYRVFDYHIRFPKEISEVTDKYGKL